MSDKDETTNGDPQMPKNLTPGNPGNKGGTGRPPNLVREAARKGYDAYITKIVPAIIALAGHIEALESEDAGERERAEEQLKRYSKLGWTPDQINKAASKLADVGLPKQAEIVLSDREILDVVSQAVVNLHGLGTAEPLLLETYRLAGEGSAVAETPAAARSSLAALPTADDLKGQDAS